ncbi:MAG: putative 2-aminoethylphosphonate ABC transporter substrate-binding protein [Clostridiales bacterium]|nr:putative 2-aminoethylphosphonate ABC transporter substrate-binding protein [Clostridiales bacterium]
MKKKWLSLVAVLAVCLSLVAAACTGNADNTGATSAPDELNAAAASGEITVYTALEDEQVEAYLAKFNETYPDIKVNIVRESTGVITAKLLAEKDNPQADVIWGTAASSMLVLDDQDMLEPYAAKGAENILDKFKSDKEVPTWIGIDAWETAFIINTQEAEKLGLPAVSSYEDLLGEAFKGHIVMSNPNSSGTGFLTVSAILQIYGEDAGWAYLDSLHENIDQYVHSGSKPAKMAAAGECAVGISFGYAGLSQMENGAPVQVVFPAEGSGWDLEANALIQKAEIKDAAKTFLDWAISDEAMDLYKENYPIITNGNVGNYDGFDTNPVDQLIDNDLKWTASNRESILEQWMKHYDGKSAEE